MEKESEAIGKPVWTERRGPPSESVTTTNLNSNTNGQQNFNRSEVSYESCGLY